MRLLHTSDWHLGTALKQVDCAQEQARFLDWLVDTLAERSVDVLVIAGDVFHYASPSNAAQKLYFGFLARCAAIDSLRKVVVVAGNHDSPTGLDAPRELLGHLDVHVVGALPRDEEQWSDCLVPVENDDGEVEMVVAAVPYVQEARLGVSLGEGGESALRQQYQAAFSRLYRRLADQARQNWPSASLVATGHLTVYGDGNEIKKGDFHTGIHRTARPRPDVKDEELDRLLSIGTIEAMGPQIFDERFEYVALGHIHRHMPVGGTRHIRYCGTPVATSLAESAPPRKVIQVDLDPARPDERLPIEPVSVPRWRELFELTGSQDELDDVLADLRNDAELPPALFLRVELGPDDVAHADRISHFQKVIADHHPAGERPLIIEVREAFKLDDDERAADGGEKLPPIEDLTHMDVFAAMYRRRYPDQDGPPDRLVEKFRHIEQQLHDNDEGAS
ncbi:MAG: exonuclease subunit SbcD [Persicimonas sp.]